MSYVSEKSYAETAAITVSTTSNLQGSLVIIHKSYNLSRCYLFRHANPNQCVKKIGMIKPGDVFRKETFKC